jgi:hypothetical protein
MAVLLIAHIVLSFGACVSVECEPLSVDTFDLIRPYHPYTHALTHTHALSHTLAHSFSLTYVYTYKRDIQCVALTSQFTFGACVS